MSYRIYKYTFPNGMVYIGMTKNSVQERRDCGYQHNKKLKEAIAKYGWKNVNTDILADELTEYDAYEMEKYFIKKYDACCEGKGYNISFGGKGTYAGLKHTDEFKKKISAMMTGRKVSSQTIERLKTSNAKYPICKCDESGKVIAKFISAREAARSVNGYTSNIVRACKSNRPYKGFNWTFGNEVV